MIKNNNEVLAWEGQLINRGFLEGAWPWIDPQHCQNPKQTVRKEKKKKKVQGDLIQNCSYVR